MAERSHPSVYLKHCKAHPICSDIRLSISSTGPPRLMQPKEGEKLSRWPQVAAQIIQAEWIAAMRRLCSSLSKERHQCCCWRQHFCCLCWRCLEFRISSLRSRSTLGRTGRSVCSPTSLAAVESVLTLDVESAIFKDVEADSSVVVLLGGGIETDFDRDKL